MKKSSINFTLTLIPLLMCLLSSSILLGSEFDEAMPVEAAVQDNRTIALKILNNYTASNNAFYSKVLSPAKDLNEQLSNYDRTIKMNEKIATDLAKILNAFDLASETNKKSAVEATSQLVDKKFSENSVAQMQFVDGSPSLLMARVVYLIEKRKNTAEQVMDVFSSYKRSAKPKDYVYEYTNLNNITQGQILTVEGTDETWMPPRAAAGIRNGQSIAIKKCRKILGWRCGTSIYSTDLVNAGDNKMKYFFIGNYDLTKNPDHAQFADDGRSENQVAGSSGLFIAKESSNWILLVGMDVSWSESSLKFQSMIESEFQKDATRFLVRLNSDLKR